MVNELSQGELSDITEPGNVKSSQLKLSVASNFKWSKALSSERNTSASCAWPALGSCSLSDAASVLISLRYQQLSVLTRNESVKLRTTVCMNVLLS